MNPNLKSNKIFLAEKKATRLLGTFIVDDFPVRSFVISMCARVLRRSLQINLSCDAELNFVLPEKDAGRVLRNGVEVEKDAYHTVSLKGGDIIRKGPTVKYVLLKSLSRSYSSVFHPRVIQETMYIYVPSSIDREIAKDFSNRAAHFGIRVTRTWSHIATHYVLDRVPEFDQGTSAVYPPELLCGLLNGSNFVTTDWLKALVEKAELPRGQGNLEDHYAPPNVDDYQPEGTQSELWKPTDNRQGLFRNVNFTILYEGSRVSECRRLDVAVTLIQRQAQDVFRRCGRRWIRKFERVRHKFRQSSRHPGEMVALHSKGSF